MVYNNQNLSFLSHPTSRKIILLILHIVLVMRAILFILIRLRCTCYIPSKPIPMAIKKVF